MPRKPKKKISGGENMRCSIGKKKIAKYKKITGLPVVGALVRGGTNHRITLLLEGDLMADWWKDGSMEIRKRNLMDTSVCEKRFVSRDAA